jgi:hypothetical protein
MPATCAILLTASGPVNGQNLKQRPVFPEAVILAISQRIRKHHFWSSRRKPKSWEFRYLKLRWTTVLARLSTSYQYIKHIREKLLWYGFCKRHYRFDNTLCSRFLWLIFLKLSNFQANCLDRTDPLAHLHDRGDGIGSTVAVLMGKTAGGRV